MTRNTLLASGAAVVIAGTALVATMNTSPTHSFPFEGDTVEVTVNLKKGPVKRDTVRDTIYVRDSVVVEPTPTPIAHPFLFAPFHEPIRNINAGLNYTGTVRVMSVSGYKLILDSVRAAKSQVGFYLTTDRKRFRFKNDTTKLNVQHWKAYVLDTLYGPRMSVIRPFIDDSTIKEIYGVDEYECVTCWGGMKIVHAQIDSLAMFTAQVFKGSDGKPVPWASRIDPSKMSYPWKYVKTSWAQFGGATHYPAACGGCGGAWAKNRGYALLKASVLPKAVDTLKMLAPPPATATTYYASLEDLYFFVGKAFADSMVKAAKTYKLGLVLGVNTMDGGDGYSKMKGIGGDLTRWIMHPSEYAGLTRAFILEPYTCFSMNWKSSYSIGTNETVANRVAALAFDTLKAVREANQKNRLLALSRTAGPCAVI